MLLEGKKILIMGIRNKWSIAFGIAQSVYENGGKLIFTYRGEGNKEKIKELNSYREEHKLDYEIEADGGIKVENSEKIIDAGADILVAGTAIINSKDYAETIKKLK